MLALYPPMSSHTQLPPFRTAMPALLRQPSQEDLDAAHQLVSSARGERHYSSETPQQSRMSQPPPLSPNPPMSEPDQALNSANDESGLGQVCSNCGTTRTPLWRRSPQGNIICNACGLYQKTRNAPRPVNVSKKSHVKSKSPRLKPAEGQAIPAMQISVPYRVPEHTPGSCPGGGQCNGAGGAVGCGGCPAFNNRMSRIAPKDDDVSSEHGSQTSVTEERPSSMVVACKNCHTTVTPLWRRDEAGHPICNACGLYHKLHGSHRPVQMKKATIKRRKRVVPAPGEAGTEAPSNASHTSVSPDPMESDESASKRIRLPPIVDFTGYRPNAEQDGFGPRSPGMGYQSLPSLPRELAQPPIRNIVQPTVQELERRRNERRTHLMREAEEMRAALRAKEREIDELER